jgi:hypothetical protein
MLYYFRAGVMRALQKKFVMVGEIKQSLLHRLDGVMMHKLLRPQLHSHKLSPPKLPHRRRLHSLSKLRQLRQCSNS